jgi:hypothetical protein
MGELRGERRLADGDGSGDAGDERAIGERLRTVGEARDQAE